ncbi:ATP-binding cassette domain-containing protein, partial [Lancefieldella rimae]
MATAIEFKHIHKAYGEKIIISDLSLTIEQGEFVTFIGSSGCGKTTLLKMVNGLTTPTSGNVLVNGEDIREKNLIELRRNIGYAIQGSVLFPHMTVEQNIAYV